MTYELQWSKRAAIFTVVVSVFLGAMAAMLVSLAFSLRAEPWMFEVFLGSALLTISVLGGTFAFAPRGYVLAGPDLLLLRRLIRPVRIPLETIEKIEEIGDTWFRGAIRIMGCADLWGYFGLFRNSQGYFTAMTTSMAGLVLVTTASGKKYVLSPKNRPGFVAMVDAARRGGKRG